MYRSGKLSNLSEDDIKVLEKLKVTKVVNFLTPEEIEHAGMDKVPESTEIILNPIDADGDWTSLLIEARITPALYPTNLVSINTTLTSITSLPEQILGLKTLVLLPDFSIHVAKMRICPKW